MTEPKGSAPPLLEVDNLPVVSSPSELAARVRAEHDANAAIVKAAGIRAD